MFRELVSRCGAVSPEQSVLLEAHYELLVRWNKVLNLTRIDDLEEAVERHYCESLFLAAHLPQGVRVADVGSGAGFPGFVIGVARPDCEVTLIESHQRKAVFLREASRGLKNIRVVSRRAEEVKDRFDWVVSRAVSYADLGPVVSVLGGDVALLTGAEEPPPVWQFSWEAVPLPKGVQRLLRVGHRVSRETD